MKKILTLVFLLWAIALAAQENNIWQPLEYFAGDWAGHETGKAGIGKGERTYQFIMNGTYLHGKNISRFEPQEKNPEGEVHEDWTFFSYDKMNKKFILRQINIEGFINTFELDSISNEGKTFVFTSTQSENAPPGLRARLTYMIENDNEFIETFELAFPDKEFSEWLRNYWMRK